MVRNWLDYFLFASVGFDNILYALLASKLNLAEFLVRYNPEHSLAGIAGLKSFHSFKLYFKECLLWVLMWIWGNSFVENFLNKTIVGCWALMQIFQKRKLVQDALKFALKFSNITIFFLLIIVSGNYFIQVQIYLPIYAFFSNNDYVLRRLIGIFEAVHTMVINISNLCIVKLDLIYFKFSLGNSLVRIKHAKLDRLAALCPNVEIVEHSKLIKEHRFDCFDDLQWLLAYFPQVDGWSDFLSLDLYFFKDQVRAFSLRNIKKMPIKYHLPVLRAVVERIAVEHVFPMLAIPDFDEGSRTYTDVVPIDAVIFNDLVMDELFRKLGLVCLSVILINRDLVLLHNVEVLAFNTDPQNISYRIAAESIVVKLLLSRCLLQHRLIYNILQCHSIMGTYCLYQHETSFFVLLTRVTATFLFEEILLVVLYHSGWKLLCFFHYACAHIKKIFRSKAKFSLRVLFLQVIRLDRRFIHFFLWFDWLWAFDVWIESFKDKKRSCAFFDRGNLNLYLLRMKFGYSFLFLFKVRRSCINL